MTFPSVRFLPIPLVLFFWVQTAFALNDPIQKLIDWETQGNAAGARSNRKIKIKNFEIPLSKLEKSFATSLDPKVKNSLIFTRDGVEYVRWVINPEDTKWYKEVARWLRKEGLSYKKVEYFNGFMTASRSYILEDPITHVSFSAKVSTNVTGGNWRDKKLPIYDAEDVRMTSDLIDRVAARVKFKNLKFELEPMMVAIRNVDQAMLVRSLEESGEGTKYYLPMFSALHEKVGREIAARNGSVDPEKFWRENLAEPLGKAYAEFFGHFGMAYDSGHGQNFLVELDLHMKPTGRIIFRDFADSYVLKPFFQNAGLNAFLSTFEKENIIDGGFMVSVGFLHGNQAPSWINDAQYRDYNETFFDAFDQRFSEISGIPVAELRGAPVRGRDFTYFSQTFKTASPEWKKYLSDAGCYQASRLADCPEEVRKRFKLYPAWARVANRKCNELIHPK